MDWFHRQICGFYYETGIFTLLFIEIAQCQPSSNYQASISQLFLYIQCTFCALPSSFAPPPPAKWRPVTLKWSIVLILCLKVILNATSIVTDTGRPLRTIIVMLSILRVYFLPNFIPFLSISTYANECVSQVFLSICYYIFMYQV